MQTENVFDRIVEKNRKFWLLTTDSSLSKAQRLELIEELFGEKPTSAQRSGS